MTEMKIFVYGSMSEGAVHFHKIKDFISNSVPAAIQGSAYRLKVGYPVLLSGGNDSVPGLLVTVQTTDLLLSLLDEFHGFNR
ncbi:MAG: gamma-glutamylcyclotransferase, partial [Pseudobdellovibrionaceae bacterium]